VVYLKALFLATVEGFTEFLPISSTGHLIIAEHLVQLTDDTAFNNAFMIVIQLPAILSVVVYFWKDLWPWGKAPEDRPRVFGLWFKAVVAFMPAAAIGPFLDDTIDAYLFAPVPVAAALVFWGIVLIGIERRGTTPRIHDVHDFTFKLALAIGVFQCLAMVPGTSRSAATIIGAMLLGAARPAAAEFSFFLAIPTMLAATSYKLLKTGVGFTGEQWAILAVGSVASFFVAWASIAFLMNYIRKHDFQLFGYYRIALGVVVLLVFLG